MKKCIPGEQNLNDLANEMLKSKIDIAQTHYEAILSQPLDMEKTSKRDINQKEREIVKLQNEISALKGVRGSQTSKVRASKKRKIKAITAEINNAIRNNKDFDKRSKLLLSLENTIMTQYAKYADHHLYNVNSFASFQALKHWAQNTLKGVPFDKFEQLDVGQLGVLDFKLKKIYSKQNKFIKGESKNWTNGWKSEQLYDPGSVLFEHDPTGLGYSLIQDTKAMPDKVFSEVNKHNQVFDAQNDKLQQLATSIKDELNLNKPEAEELKRKAVAQLFELMDEQLMYFKPTPAYKYENGKIVPLVNIETKNAIKAAVKRNQDNGLHGTGDFKTMQVGGDVAVFLPLKQLREDNREVYEVFEIPYHLHESGQIKILNPFIEENVEEHFESGVRLADYTTKAGKSSKGYMKEGYYQATTQKHDVANYNLDNEHPVLSYQNYVESELASATKGGKTLSIDTEEFWDVLHTLRQELKKIYEFQFDAVKNNENYLKGIVANIYKEFKKTGKKINLKRGFTKPVIEAMIKEVGNISGVNANFVIKGDELYSSNQVFNQRVNYFPQMTYDGDYIANTMKGIDKTRENIDNWERSKEAANSAGDLDMVNKLDERISDAQENIKDAEIRLDIKIGKLEVHDLEIMEADGSINVTKQIKHARSRRGWMKPITVINSDGVVTNRGMRKDFKVLSDYARESYTTIEQQKIRTKLMSALPHFDAMTGRYVIDHVKRSFGRTDVEAGFGGFDYSDKRIQGILERILGKKRVSMKAIRSAVDTHSGLMSASLLMVGAPITNNFQITNIAVRSGYDRLIEVMALYNNPRTHDIVVAGAENAGVTDVIVALADALTGLTGDVEFLSGPTAIGDLMLLKLDRGEFLRKYKDSLWGGFIERRLNEQSTTARANMEDLKDLAAGDLWQGLHNLTDETFTGDRKKQLRQHLKRILKKEKIDSLIGWSLEGGVYGKFEGLKSWLSMTGTEKRMRIYAFLDGALDAWGLMDQSRFRDREDKNETFEEWLLRQPEAIAAGRMSVQLTMYGISPAYMSKMFAGVVGKAATKFKPFQWHQTGEEIVFVENFHALHNDYNDPAIKNILNSAYQTGKLLTGALPWTDTSHLSKPEKQFRDYLLYKGLVSMIGTLIQMQGPLHGTIKHLLYASGNYRVANALFRGGESVLISSIFATIFNAWGLTAGFEDEDLTDEWLDAFMWMWAPMLINTAYQAARAEDGWDAAGRTLQLYFKPLSWLVGAGGKFAEEVSDMLD